MRESNPTPSAVSTKQCRARSIAVRAKQTNEQGRPGSNLASLTPIYAPFRTFFVRFGSFWRPDAAATVLPLQVIAVGEGVLVPRPETELLVDFALEASAAQGGALRSLPWADLGTGSGALAVALARGLPGGAAVGALDASPTALHWAAANAERLAPRGRVRCVRGSWERAAGEADVAAAGLGEACGVPSPSTAGAFAGVVSNPPYIPAARLPSLQAEVREYEPWLALDGDSDGQRVAADYPEDIPGVRVPFEAARLAARLLAPGGFLAMEVDGAAQSHALAEAMARRSALGEAVAFDSVEVRQDYAGVERFIVGLRS